MSIDILLSVVVYIRRTNAPPKAKINGPCAGKSQIGWEWWVSHHRLQSCSTPIAAFKIDFSAKMLCFTENFQMQLVAFSLDWSSVSLATDSLLTGEKYDLLLHEDIWLFTYPDFQTPNETVRCIIWLVKLYSRSHFQISQF